jgi:hypothetical protein
MDAIVPSGGLDPQIFAANALSIVTDAKSQPLFAALLIDFNRCGSRMTKGIAQCSPATP